MKVLPRLIQLYKADVHGALDRLEDKTLLLKQCFREMDEDLSRKDLLVSDLKKKKHQIQDDMDHCNKKFEKIGKDLGLTLRKEKDDIARMLIRRRFHLEENQKRLRQEYNDINNRIKELLTRLKDQKQRYKKIQANAIAFNLKNGHSPLNGNGCQWKESAELPVVTKQEIELELLQLKESFKKRENV